LLFYPKSTAHKYTCMIHASTSAMAAYSLAKAKAFRENHFPDKRPHIIGNSARWFETGQAVREN